MGRRLVPHLFDIILVSHVATAFVLPYLSNPQETHRAVKAGQWGDAIFKRETVVRPDILLSIMGQGYKVLWTDVDIVWLGNPMPLLPDTNKNATAVRIIETPLAIL